MKFGLKVFSKCKNNGELSLFSISTILKRIFLLEIDPDAEMQHINLKLLNLAAKEHIWVQRSPLIFKNYLFSNLEIKPLFNSSKAQIMFCEWPALASAMHQNSANNLTPLRYSKYLPRRRISSRDPALSIFAMHTYLDSGPYFS